MIEIDSFNLWYSYDRESRLKKTSIGFFHHFLPSEGAAKAPSKGKT